MTTTDTAPTTADTPGPSVWQRRITGEWHGRPSLFDADGTWCGYEDTRRSSVHEDGTTTYLMDGSLTAGGPLAGRLRLGAPFAFGVVDSDADRLYTGPDFHGSGQPYGSFVDARYYGPGWQVALNTWNQVLADGDTQVYSSVLYQGWAVVGCFNGVYRRTDDFDTNSVTRTAVAAFLDEETTNGPVSFILPTKEATRYAGECQLWSARQEFVGDVRVGIDVEPLDLLRSRLHTTWSGAVDRRFTVERRRDGTRSFIEGPDAWGNAQAFGRASFSRWHFTHSATEVKGREFVIDTRPGMNAGRVLAVAYELFDGNRLTGVLHGTLTREDTP
ncbi:hypothetical protein B4N89_00725 [Embleya scabrispora]|uniref:Uncharacterized protein n=1 Tax=Embleya scabrispora TaxID=159449 RepID=A0A1T3NSC8_9ACTN|nr:hypothetical protein [Embleya scabrispora]OPC79664.1 hypothetical protein B4N89_00725 [Embleya scabrispora]